MSKVLVRGGNTPDNAEVLDDAEFIRLCYSTIKDKTVELENSTESSQVLDALSDILELSMSIIQKENITAQNLFAHAMNRRNVEGSFLDKKAITKE